MKAKVEALNKFSMLGISAKKPIRSVSANVEEQKSKTKPSLRVNKIRAVTGFGSASMFDLPKEKSENKKSVISKFQVEEEETE